MALRDYGDFVTVLRTLDGDVGRPCESPFEHSASVMLRGCRARNFDFETIRRVGTAGEQKSANTEAGRSRP